MATILDSLKVEVAFASTPDAASPTWTDISGFVLLDKGISISRGRQDEFTQVQPGKCTLTLNNDDGRFTPGNTSGAYYPNVLLRKKLRVSVLVSAVRYYLFTGYVNEWPIGWTTDYTIANEATVTAVDRLQRLGDNAVFRSIIEQEYLLDTPSVLYTLGDAAGSTSAGDTSTVGTGAMSIVKSGNGNGTVVFGNATGPGTDGLTAATFTPNDVANGKYLIIGNASIPWTSGQTIECFINTTWTNPSDEPAFGWAVVTNMGYIGIRYDGYAVGQVNVATPAPMSSAAAGVKVNDGATHHLAVVLTTTTQKLYVDGVQVDSDTNSVGTITTTQITVGGGKDSTGTFSTFNGTIAHVAVYPVPLSAARILAHATAGLTGFSGETPAARIGRYASYLGIPSGEQSLDTGLSTIGASDIGGQSPAAAMQAVADAENGVLQMAGDGTLQFSARSDRYNAASVYTLDAGDADPPPQFVVNDQHMYNDVTVSRPNGITYRATNATSITAYGLVRTQQTLILASDAEVVEAANWKVAQYSTPSPRVPNLAVDLLTNTGIASSILPLDIGSLITVNNLPSAAPASSIALFIEGWTDSISVDGWARVYNTSPGTATGAFWKLGDASFGQLGSTTVLAY